MTPPPIDWLAVGSGYVMIGYAVYCYITALSRILNPRNPPKDEN